MQVSISWPGTDTSSGQVFLCQVTKESFLYYESLFLTNAVIIWLHKSINLYTYIYKIQWKEEILVKINQQYVALPVSQVDHNVSRLSMVWITKRPQCAWNSAGTLVAEVKEKIKCEASSLRDFQKGGICKAWLLVQIARCDKPSFMSLFTY